MDGSGPPQRGIIRRRPPPPLLALLGLLLAGGGAALLLARPSAAPLVQTLPGDPSAVAVDPRSGHTFVACLSPGTVPGLVVLLDTRTGALLRTVIAGYNPSALAVASRAGRVFVLTGNATIMVLDAQSGALLRTLSLGGRLPFAVAADERTGHVFVDTVDGRLLLLDAATGTIRHAARLGGHPGLIALDTAHGRGVVATVTATQERISVFDTHTGTLLRTVAVDAMPSKAGGFIALDPSSGTALVTEPPAGRVSVVDLRRGRVVRAVAVAPELTEIALLPRGRRAVVLAEGPVTAAVLDARSGRLVRTDRTALVPAALVADPRTGHLVVLRQGVVEADGLIHGPGRIDILDGQSGALLRTLPADGVPVAGAVDPVAGRLVVAYRGGRAAAGTGAWVPSWARRWLPFLPPPSRIVPPGVRIVSLSR